MKNNNGDNLKKNKKIKIKMEKMHGYKRLELMGESVQDRLEVCKAIVERLKSIIYKDDG